MRCALAAGAVCVRAGVTGYGEGCGQGGATGWLTHTDGLYFTVTVLSTVGFGDITAKIQAARLVVTGQMIADLVIFALAVKVIVGAVSRGRQQGDASSGQPARETRR
ncbi:hypothetical protein EAS64_41860 [Trebonia kvetii]|uniref:Potassium channel domain-containing protein n=1 Tax=Trebonia kvetii TaxID=2480626 RepID=A0A6P2BL08_9ACTN|nr:hypothetical protein EAS64_41860 [Trebonia kvetii]